MAANNLANSLQESICLDKDSLKSNNNKENDTAIKNTIESMVVYLCIFNYLSNSYIFNDLLKYHNLNNHLIV